MQRYPVVCKKASEIYRNINLGRDEDIPGNPNPGERWKNLLLVAFGQKKMFRIRLLVNAFCDLCRVYYHQY